MSRIERPFCKTWRLSIFALPAFGILACEPPSDDAAEPVDSVGSSPQSQAAPAPAPESDGGRAPQQVATSAYAPPPVERALARAETSDSETANAVAHAEMRLIEDDTAIGTVEFRSTDAQGLEIIARLNGLEPGLHGIHIHENGDCSGENASAAGEHFSPDGDLHGSPAAGAHHAGDLGNLAANQAGGAEVFMTDAELSLDGAFGVVDRAFVIHAGEDDLTTQPGGNSGDPVACGVIRSVSEGVEMETLAR